jgi:hypothetical protein
MQFANGSLVLQKYNGMVIFIAGLKIIQIFGTICHISVKMETESGCHILSVMQEVQATWSIKGSVSSMYKCSKSGEVLSKAQ